MLYTKRYGFRILILTFLAFPSFVSAQSTPPSPADHMREISNIDQALQQNYLDYMSAVAHANSTRKVEKRRAELITSIQESLRNTGKLRPYQGDASLRDTYMGYLRILLSVFKEDYHKIVNMEEIAEQSYDNMEAYLMAQEQAGDKLEEAAEKIEPAYNDFAAKHGVNLIEPDKESKLSRKLKVTGMVNHYYHEVFLIYFKSHHQEGYLIQAVSGGDLNAVEQNKNSLARYATEGLKRLDTLKPYQNDGSLTNACRKVLEFLKTEADEKTPIIVEYLIKKDEFEKTQKAYQAGSQHSQADVDKYNKLVNEVNAAGNSYNKAIQELNQSRAKASDHWHNTKKRFLDSHTPKAR